MNPGVTRAWLPAYRPRRTFNVRGQAAATSRRAKGSRKWVQCGFPLMCCSPHLQRTRTMTGCTEA
ncbi:hypothetical protein DIE08_10650 [Burkholderia sp. Bp9004]|nr:hypothetical protein DIE08_10650 [Burkholderia sp. Bp9004]